MTQPIVIVGAGQAGAALAAKLRALGYGGPLALIGEEPVAPYQRPPLSKRYVSGELAFDRLLVRPLSWYAEQNIDLRTGCRVRALSPTDRSITLNDGTTLGFSKLALTTGSRPRTLPAAIGGALANVFTLRTLADADAIAPLLIAGKRLLVIGGGYIGLEAAAIAAGKGMQVTLIEMAERILQRVAAKPTADYFRALHSRHGVAIHESTGLERLLGEAGRLVGARLSDGAEVAADIAIVGIGIAPRDELARAAGLGVENGIIVDGRCETSAPGIFAAGDCAIFPWHGMPTRLESVQNAIDQAEHAAAAMLGPGGDYNPVPWFWSDQYDTKLQIAGLNRGYTDAILRPGKRENSLSVWYYHGETLIAVDAINDALAYGVGKKVLEARRSIPKAAVGDPASELKMWLAAG